MPEPTTPETKTPKRRSPNYPAVALMNAVARAKKIYDQDGPAGAPEEAAYRHIGFSGPHGQAMTVMSALKKFGLVEDRAGRIVPTKLAIDLFEFPEGNQRHSVALKEAALSPEIYRQLYDCYMASGGRLPSDASLKPELIADKGFNPKMVDGILRDFRETLEFAGLLNGNQLQSAGGTGMACDTDTDAGDRPESESSVGVHEETSTRTRFPQEKRRMVITGMKEDVFTLEEGDVVLQWPEAMTSESATDLEDWFSLVMRKIKRSIAASAHHHRDNTDNESEEDDR